MSWMSLAADGLFVLYVLVTVGLAGTGSYYGLIAVERIVRDIDQSHTTPAATHHATNGGPTRPPGERPLVTVQIPVYNERHVIGRVLRAVGNLDWPVDRLQVQVLDDSTDDTSAVIAEWLGRLRAKGIQVEHIQRDDRTGYKAGAVQRGLRTADGELIALFDADFVPPSDFLLTTVPYFETATVGCVQTRWDHLNEDDSWFTRAQALALDAHFAVEQWVRAEVGSLMSFNATSCVWRRETLDAVGGWSSETIAEDLDLTAEALQDGWEFVYTEGYAVPCEIPATLSAFVRQQTRWARGSTQNVRKHLAGILRMDDSPRWARFHSVMHVCHYLFFPLLLAWIGLHTVVTVVGSAPRWLLLGGFLGTTPGPLAFLALGQLFVDRDGTIRRLLAVVPLTLVGIGIAWRMSRAVIGGFLEMGGTFVRTPKSGASGPRRGWVDTQYDEPLDTVVPELLLGGWCALSAGLALTAGAFRMAPSMGSFSIAFLVVAGLAVWER